MTRTEPAGGAERAFRPAVAIAALVGLALRVAWGQWVARPPQGLVDPVRYLGYGRAIADGHGFIEPWSGFPTAYYPPGYPWFLGIVTWVGTPFTDDLPLLVAMVQAALGAVTVVPGFVDMHTHGGGSGAFPEATDQSSRAAVDLHRRHGTTTLIASLLEDPRFAS